MGKGKKLIIGVAMVVCILALYYLVAIILFQRTSDTNSGTDEATGGMSLASFCWEDDAAKYQDGDANVNPNAFVNTDTHPISDQIEAEERAKNEITIEYNAVSHYRDTEAGMWLIDFHTLEWTDDRIPIVSNRQKIYLDDNGVTQLIVYEVE